MLLELISIGDEILSGDILNTNTQYLSENLWQRGFKVEFHTSIRDDEDKITDALTRAATRADAVIVTGGLGPTADDFTIDVAAKVFGVGFFTDEPSIARMQKMFSRRGRVMNENNKKQALIPIGGKALVNEVGTAPGVYFCFHGVHFYFLPGVPREMKHIFAASVLPDLLLHRKDKTIFKTHVLKTFGCAESELDERLSDLFHDRTHIQNARIGFRAHFPEIFIKISVWGAAETGVIENLATVVAKVKERIGEFVFSENPNQKMEELLVEKLTLAGKTMAVAESCTGGRVASRLTDVSGASVVFKGGVVSYSNELKVTILGVEAELIKKHGAVSEECAVAMVNGIKKITGADFCAAVTGIAGPTGGSPDKPVGTVWVAWLYGETLETKMFYFPFTREMFKEITANVMMYGVIKKLAP